jgi:hypothetical protein
MAKLHYAISFDVQGDAGAALTGLAARLSIGTGWDFGKARVMVSKLTRLSGPKKQIDSLGLKAMAGMIEDVLPGSKNKWLAREEFASLEAAIRAAILKRFGKGYWIIDFSPSEVILAQAAAVESQYWKISYKLTNGEVDFEGALISVKRVTDYV